MDAAVPVLLDTDIGSDVDDAVCLAYLLAEPRCDLLGITTVTGRPQERAMLADALCRAAGRHGVPVYSGCDVPLLCEQRQPEVPQARVLPRWPHRDDFEPYAAVPFLRRTIRERPGEVTLLAVGPLTNVGLLFATDAEVPRLLKRLVLMGGRYFGSCGEEWNTGGDPIASALVFGAPVCELTAYGLDVTLQCSMPAPECRERFRGGALDLVREMSEVWFLTRERITFHDPLAAACVFEPDLCTYRTGRVAVDLQGAGRGATRFEESAGGPHRVAADVDVGRFFRRYFETIGAPAG
ncbi:MAG: nucleoside hydrolase [Candidatus Brocadiaceae bacterium]|nr:nucleoside hydrolase [Candidatus Brocadiaceae bacterium]